MVPLPVYLSTIVRTLIITAAVSIGTYVGLLALLMMPVVQDHVIYLHRIKLTRGRNVHVPEQWGFLRNQLTSFYLSTPDGGLLHAWHVLPLSAYHLNEEALGTEPTGICHDITTRIGFSLLRDDPTARVVLYLHGAAGTLASGWRPQSYRALSAGVHNLHVLAIDYRGFGGSTGWPSEPGLLVDALSLVEFSSKTAGVPLQRTAIFGQSLGTAVAISLAHHLAFRAPPQLVAGMVLVAPFASIEPLTRTYRVAGTVPLLEPLAQWSQVLSWLNTFIVCKWPSKEKLAELMCHAEGNYHVTIIHAEDDYDIPAVHSDVLFWHTVSAIESHDPSAVTDHRKTMLGDGGWERRWTGKGKVMHEHVVKYGFHDRIMSYPAASLAIARIFQNRDST